MAEESPRTSSSGEVSTVEMYPQFHLTYATDWEAAPNEVTIYPAGAPGDRTRWITADHRDTVSVDEVR
jgi:hypothetical protein